ncbi:MAG: P-loop NTPase, partial [Bdellovibrio sp.]
MGATRIAIGAGKGGVGKSFVTANLGITLAKLGKRICLVDFDLTSANLHTSLGQDPSSKNISRYFFDSAPLKEQIVQTLVPQVSMIQGFWDQWSPVQISPSQTEQLLQDLAGLNFDFVLLDLGPGAMDAYLQSFSTCEERILITSPEPTSLEKTYRFLEAH